MKTTDIIKRAGRSLKSSKIRTVLTSLAIAVGAFTLTLSLAAGTGAREYADKLVKSNVDPQSLAVTKSQDSFSFSGPNKKPQEYDPNGAARVTQNGVATEVLTQNDIDSIRARNDIERITPLYNVAPSYITREGQKKYVGSVSTYDANVSQKVLAGKLPKLGNTIKRNQITIPKDFVSVLGFTSENDAIGQEIMLHVTKSPNISQERINEILSTQGVQGLQMLGEEQSKNVTFEVVAVLGKSSLSFAASPEDFQISDGAAKELTDYATEGTSQFQKYNFASAIVTKGSDTAAVKKALQDKGYGVQTAKDLQGFLFTTVNILQGIVGGFGIIVLITSVFGIINTQYISVLERTREIGLMKALGMRGSSVSRLFQFEAAWIGFIGGVLGAVTAVIAGIIANPYITDALELGDSIRLLIFEALPTIGLVLALMIIAMLAGYFPARKAAKLDPIEALRTE